MLAVPTVHLNGTSKQELLDQLQNAFRAVREAQNVLAKAAPHGRDYYVQDADHPAMKGGAIFTAQAQHHARMAKLAGVCEELEQIAIAVQDQGRK